MQLIGGHVQGRADLWLVGCIQIQYAAAALLASVLKPSVLPAQPLLSPTPV